MIVERARIPEVLVFKRVIHSDERGRFGEVWRENAYGEAGVPESFLQDNASVSRQNVLRGLHFQHPGAQGKLVTVLDGQAFQAMVDVRRGSPTFGEHLCFTLSGAEATQVYVPPGFAHGILMMTTTVVLNYKCTEYYDPASARCILWDDPALGIEWPVGSPTLSAADAGAPLLAELPEEELPTY